MLETKALNQNDNVLFITFCLIFIINQFFGVIILREQLNLNSIKELIK